MSSGQYGGKVETKEEADRRRRELLRTLSLGDFVDLEKPWVLVHEGSLLGYFDWVPKHLRHGPWALLASLYIFVLVYGVMIGTAWIYGDPEVVSKWKDGLSDDYPAPYSVLWCYNLVGFLWMLFVIGWIYAASHSFRAWVTYTVQSWSIITVRHGLSVYAPFLPKGHYLLSLLEILRFPALLTASNTFFIWNFMVGPFIYFFGMKTPEMRKSFRNFFMSARLTQLHVFNILYAVMNAVIACSPRKLTILDFHVAITGTIVYVLFYLMILDRIGVHFYPVFSPRTPFFVLTFSLSILLLVAWFIFWGRIIEEDKWRSFVTNYLET